MKPAIADGHVVTIHYRLTLDDGSVADQSFGGEPMPYLHGSQNIVPGLERQLAGIRQRYEGNAPQLIYADIFWGLFNSTEFAFNH